MTLIRDSKTSERRPIINSLSSLEVVTIQGTTLNVKIEVFAKAFSFKRKENQEIRLRVQIHNSGEYSLSNLSIDFVAPEGISIADPGLHIGTSRRHLRLPILASSKKKTYKFSLKASAKFESGILRINMHETNFDSPKAPTELRIGLTSV